MKNSTDEGVGLSTGEPQRSGQCEQCGSMAPLQVHEEFGRLCPLCAFRQSEHDEARDSFAHLSPSNFGFLSESE